MSNAGHHRASSSSGANKISTSPPPSSDSLRRLPTPATHSPNGHSKLHPRTSASMTYPLWRLRRLLSRPLLWVVVVLVTLGVWWSGGAYGSDALQTQEIRTRLKDLLPPEVTKNLQFWPASHHMIHFVGRWTTAPNRLRIDGAFPGVYFDLNVTNTTSVVLSLQNTHASPSRLPDLEAVVNKGSKLSTHDITRGGQYSFSAASRLRIGAPPISLLALVDQEEYVILPNATGLSAVRMGDLKKDAFHSIRVVAPMTENGGTGVFQLDGIYLDKGGQLHPVEGSIADTISEEMDAFDAEGDASIGAKHRLAWVKLLQGHGADDAALKKNAETKERDSRDKTDDIGEFRRRRKLVEIVTDDPANFRGRKQRSSRSGGVDGLLAGVMGWEYLLGEMFSVDHVCVGVEGMCLLQNCVGGTGSPSGLGDVFFRSGPVDSPHFGHPWPFQSYAPDVLIFNLGSSDYYSIVNRVSEYNTTGGELFRHFEDTYVSLIKAIRTMAYPNHPATIEMQRLGVDGYAQNTAPATIPIFIMRPFGGELEWASQGAVNRLRGEGDKGVFWLDTSGWLDFEGTQTRSADVFKDETVSPPRYHLSERGNQKVAIYLHMHVCRYLAADNDKCAFLPPEVYQGQVFDSSVATFERYIENEKERQLHDLFWTSEDKDDQPILVIPKAPDNMGQGGVGDMLDTNANGPATPPMADELPPGDDDLDFMPEFDEGGDDDFEPGESDEGNMGEF